MKQLVILSGKGGTGKTTVTAALAAMAQNTVLADCDVDAADLHLILQPSVRKEFSFQSGKEPHRNEDICTRCAVCGSVCRFNAITAESINYYHCEGCSLCARVCPVNAIDMVDKTCGAWFISDTPYGTLVHARLIPGEENSGKLVACVRTAAQQEAKNRQAQYILIDGPPGIGCPVIASVSGCDAALIVTEPTVSGIHDLKRVLGVIEHFGVKAFICINKWDINGDKSNEIEQFGAQRSIPVICKIPFDQTVVDALMARTPIVDYNGSALKDTFNRLWQTLTSHM